MFRTFAALLLAGLLAVMAYGIFWLVSLDYTTTQMKTAVREAIGADMTYGTPQWVPDTGHVTMDLPAVKLAMADGPVREVRANNLRLLSSFLMRDRWTMQLPQRVEVLLANGKTLLLETEKGEVSWLRDGGQLTLRAEKVALLALDGRSLLELDDVVMERRASDRDVRLNLASRPKMQGGTGVVSGQVTMPPAVFATVVNSFGSDTLPTLGHVLGLIAEGLRSGGMLKLENISFKMPSGVSGALYGQLSVLADGRATGTLVLTSDSVRRTYDWVQRAGLMVARNAPEERGAARFVNGLERARGTARMENMQATLMLNGEPVGALPVLSDVVNRLWN